MKRVSKYLIGIALICALGVAYTKMMMRVGSEIAPQMISSALQADEIIVLKSKREMRLLRDGRVIQKYAISLGANPQGHKQQEGDKRTPEGRYTIDWRNQNSVAHLSLHISYPNAADRAAAQELGVSPGGNIMIHGLLNGWGFLGQTHRVLDWTNGCIAVTNAEMREIWSMVPNGTPISIVDQI